MSTRFTADLLAYGANRPDRYSAAAGKSWVKKDKERQGTNAW